MYGIDVIGPVNPIALQSEPQWELPYFLCIWNGGSDAFGSRNLLIKNTDRFWARKGRVGQSEIWTTKPAQWEDDSCDFSSLTLLENNG